MSVIRAEISKPKLTSLPADEQTLLLGLAHLYNEVNALTKVLYWSAITPAETPAEKDGCLFLQLTFIQLLAGKLNEGWELLTGHYFGTALSRVYDSSLAPSGVEALAHLRRYFGRTNPIHAIRNSFAFHYQPQELATVLPQLADPLCAYMEAHVAPNNLFFFAETLVLQALSNLLSMLPRTRTFEQLIDELFKVAASFAAASDAIIDSMLSATPHPLTVGEPEQLAFSSLRRFEDVFIPWFTDTSHVQQLSIGSA